MTAPQFIDGVPPDTRAEREERARRALLEALALQPGRWAFIPPQAIAECGGARALKGETFFKPWDYREDDDGKLWMRARPYATTNDLDPLDDETWSWQRINWHALAVVTVIGLFVGLTVALIWSVVG